MIKVQASLSSYKYNLLPKLKEKTTYSQQCKIAALKKSKNNPCKPIEYISQQKYKNKDTELERNGYKIVKNVIKDKHHLNLLHKISDIYDFNMLEFADKDNIMKVLVDPILSDEKFIDEYSKVFKEPFLWQKTTIHRKKKKSNMVNFDKECITAEHMDITETPNSLLTITAYVAITDQTKKNDSKLLIYPKSHINDIYIPKENFDYVSSLMYNTNQSLFCQINEIVNDNPNLDWVRECFYHLIVLNLPEYKILKSTFMIMLLNASLFEIKPIEIELEQGDVLYFLSNVLHGSTQHKNEKSSRVSLAVRGGYPDYEESSLISQCISRDKYGYLKKDHFLFSGTPNMLSNIKKEDLEKYKDIIYEI